MTVYLTFTIWAFSVSYKERYGVKLARCRPVIIRVIMQLLLFLCRFLTDTRYYWIGCTKLPCDFFVSQGLYLLYCAEMGYYMQVLVMQRDLMLLQKVA